MFVVKSIFIYVWCDVHEFFSFFSLSKNNNNTFLTFIVGWKRRKLIFGQHSIVLQCNQWQQMVSQFQKRPIYIFCMKKNLIISFWKLFQICAAITILLVAIYFKWNISKETTISIHHPTTSNNIKWIKWWTLNQNRMKVYESPNSLYSSWMPNWNRFSRNHNYRWEIHINRTNLAGHASFSYRSL